MSTCKKVILLVLHYVFINGTKMKFWAVVLDGRKLAEWCSALVIMTPCCTSSDIEWCETSHNWPISVCSRHSNSNEKQGKVNFCNQGIETATHLIYCESSEWECGDIQVCACSKATEATEWFIRTLQTFCICGRDNAGEGVMMWWHSSHCCHTVTLPHCCHYCHILWHSSHILTPALRPHFITVSRSGSFN